MVRTKVFVGNLDFQTKEQTLVQHFEAAGKVISANIITRGPRSLGYGFVEMDSEEDAEKAVQLMSKKEVDGRPINVEVAKLRDETQQAPTEGTRGGRGGARGRGGRGRGAAPVARGGAAPTRGAFRPRGRGGKQVTGEGQQPTTTTTTTTQQPQPRRERKEENRTPSKTTLFVANLPFKMEDDAFSAVFKDAGLAFKSAHVVKNQRSGRSKGFGFVEFENEQDQQKALAAIDKKVVDERELAVKVALTENPAKPTEEPAKI